MGSGGGGGSVRWLGREASIKTFTSLVKTVKAFESKTSQCNALQCNDAYCMPKLTDPRNMPNFA